MPHSTAITFNLTDALERFCGDRELIREIAMIFVQDAPGLLETLQNSVRTAQWTEACRAVHTMKSLAADFGAEPTHSCAAELENQLRGLKSPTAEQLERLEADAAHLQSLICSTTAQLQIVLINEFPEIRS